MKPIIRTIAIAAFATAATIACAQTNGGSTNSIRRSGDNFSYGHGNAAGGTYSSGNTGNDTGFGRPQPRSFQGAVTPVPEPSEWAMMLAGLALVGFIVRRNAKRS
jgi:hypothetical protein